MLKKILLSITALTIASTAIASEVNTKFTPINWTSVNKQQIISVDFYKQSDNTMVGKTFYVQIYVSQSSYFKPSTGITLKNCGVVKTLEPGSSAICALSENNPVISFSSNTDDENKIATGTYQVEF